MHQDFRDHLKLIIQDRALTAQLAHQEPALYELCRDWVSIIEANRPKPAKGPFPSVAGLTAVQAAIFDNWPDGRAPARKPNRYGMQIEMWTADPDRIRTHLRRNYQRKAEVRLMSSAEMLKWCKTRRRDNAKRLHPLSDDFITALENFSSDLGPNEFVGLLGDKDGEGTVYYDMQFAYARIDPATDEVMVRVILDGQLELAPFSKEQANGVPFSKVAGNIILQSRNDLSGFSTSWATGVAVR